MTGRCDEMRSVAFAADGRTLYAAQWGQKRGSVAVWRLDPER